MTLVCAAAPRAMAQTANRPVPPPPTPVTTWDNGLSVRSADGADEFQIGGFAQVYGRFTANGLSPSSDMFVVRRARVLVQGRVAKYFEFRIAPNLSGTVSLSDAYIDTKVSDALRIRVGKSKNEVGLEALYPAPSLPFVERSIVTNFAPGHDVGVNARGDLFHGRVSYAGGVRNGVADGASASTDTDRSKDLVGRITLKLGPAGVAVGGSRGNAAGPLSSFTTTARETFFSYASSAAADGMRERVSPSVFVFHGPFGGYGEYFRTSEVVANGVTAVNLVNTGWEATGIVVATGERLSDHGPGAARHPFDPAHGEWGALEIAVRMASVSIDPRAFSLGIAAPDASRSARAVGLAVAWVLTPDVRNQFTYERTAFEAGTGAARKTEHAFIFSLQVSLVPRL